MSYKDRLLEAARTAGKPHKVEVPGFSEPVFMREISGADRDKYEASLVEYRDKQGNIDVLGHGNKITARLLIQVIVDEQGNRVFDDDDVDLVRQAFPWRVMEKLSTEALRINRVTDEAVKDSVKNS